MDAFVVYLPVNFQSDVMGHSQRKKDTEIFACDWAKYIHIKDKPQINKNTVLLKQFGHSTFIPLSKIGTVRLYC